MDDRQSVPLLNRTDVRSAGPAEGWSGRTFLWVLAGVLAVVFGKVWLGLESFFYRDYGVLGYPFAFYAHESFWRGELPLWNPLSNCGAPFLAQWGTMVLYPFSLIYLVLPLPWSLGVFCLLHLLLAGAGMYRLALAWTGNRWGASVAGLAFALGGASLSSLTWPNYTVVLGWMPWVVWLAERSWREGGKTLILAALAGAMQMLSGVPELIVLTWLVVAALWLVEVWAASPPRSPLVNRFGLLVLLVGSLAAVQLLPFLDLLVHSQRDAQFATGKEAMPLWGWANLLLPMFHNFQTPQGTWFQAGQTFLSSYYPGAGVLLLALLAVSKDRSWRVRLLGVLALFALVMAWGEQGVIYNLARTAVPALGHARYPIKFVFLAAFLLPLLAAYAVSHLQSSSAEKRLGARRWLLMGALVGLALMALLLWQQRAQPMPFDRWPETLRNSLERAGWLAGFTALVALWLKDQQGRWQRWLPAGVLAVLALDLLTHKALLTPTIPASALAPGLVKFNPPVTAGQARVFILPQAEQALLHHSVPNFHQGFLGVRLALWSNLNLLEAVPKVNGSSTLQLREQKQVQDLLYADPPADLPRLIDFLAASMMTSPTNLTEWVPRPTALPWITAGQAPIFAAAEETLAALKQPGFNPRDTVYLPKEVQGQLDASKAVPSAKVILRSFAAQRIEFDVHTPEPTLAVLAQSFYYPWTAYVDGVQTSVLRANNAFQAVAIPRGERRVELVYEDHYFKAGLSLTLASLLGCLVAWKRINRLG